VPLVSVLLAVHGDAGYLPFAVRSVLDQTVRDLELIVVDDASTDDTPAILSALSDTRLVVVTNDEQLGLAGSLNRGLERAGGRYVARLDADDIAFPDRLARQLTRIQSAPPAAAVGAAVIDVDAEGNPGRMHRLPSGPTALRWHALFSSPFFHPTVLVDREVLDRHGLRYDPSYLESEDYDLWTRLFAAGGEGDNLQEALVLKRVHAGQASARRRDLQESFQREVALREIARIAPELPDAELAWSLGSGRGLPAGSTRRAGESLLALLAEFERLHGDDASVRESAARALARARLLRPLLKLAPWLPAHVVLDRLRRPARERGRRREASAVLAKLRAPAAAIRVAVVSPEPTPYRSPLFDRVATRPELDLTVIYAGRTVAGRTWSVEPRHAAMFLSGARVPGLRRVLRHDYPFTPGIGRALRRVRPDVVVVSGWSTFASQAAIAWCRAHHVPYVLLVESHDLGPRATWRRKAKDAVVPRLIGAAAGALVVGTAARESVIARGSPPARVRIFANTIDVDAWEERARQLAAQRRALRVDAGIADDEVVILSVARLVREKGLDILVRAIAEAGDQRLRLMIAGDGPKWHDLVDLAAELGVRGIVQGGLPEDELARRYAEADVFALLSLHEPWGVVVNEAAASGLPLVLSDRVGAAYDLLRDGENGFLVPAGDVGAAATALKRLAADRTLRRELGARAREIVRDWGYGPSVENFVAAVREATSR
jgi:glycosyltransferase involved in cell wall biosynthesis/GT2 family glycosyltransferase